MEAMDNDLNTAQALGVIFETVKDLNRLRQQLPTPAAPGDLEFLRELAGKLTELCGIMGLLGEPPTAFLQSLRARELAELTITPAEIEQLIIARREARAAKNWGRADEIRDQLLAAGIELKDGAAGTTWQAKKD